MAGSAVEVTMPQMGAEMEEGTLLRWLKHPGDHVQRGEVIAEIETDKANIEIESFEEGVLQRTLVDEGQVVPVGEAIALIEKQSGTQGGASPGASLPPTSGPAAADSTGTPDQDVPIFAEPGPASQAPAALGTDISASNNTIPPENEAAQATGQTASNGHNAATSAAASQRLRASPVARSMAAALRVDLTTVSGSGPGGRITRKDVERAAATTEGAALARPAPGAVPSGAREQAPPAVSAAAISGEQSPAQLDAIPVSLGNAAAAPGGQTDRISESMNSAATITQPGSAVPEIPVTAPATPSSAPPPGGGTEPSAFVPFSRMRAAIARTMAQSKREAPHYYVTAEVDMTEAMQFRELVNNAGGDAAHVSVNDLIVKACAIVLERFPRFNASLADGGITMHGRINICIAIAVPDGLIAPALLDTAGKSLGAIAHQSAELSGRARDGGLRGRELSEGTFTVSNLGMYGIETLIPIIQPPQSAILGVGAVLEKPAVRDGQLVIRSLMMVALAADHRVTNGAEGGEFLRELKRVLEHPVGLAL